ncbi:MAG: SprB repeat-containing protein [Bacteroidetes bacterium]|nr:SprB repeat-containing protein [Bacteroidota bacterium]
MVAPRKERHRGAEYRSCTKCSMVPSPCFGTSGGEASATASGGTPGYTYLWSNGQTTPTATGYPAGAATVTVTDVNGCTAISTIQVTQPSQMSAFVTSVNVSCNGGSNGSATVIPSGGTPGYTYSWSPSGGTGATASNLSAGPILARSPMLILICGAMAPPPMPK